MGTGKSYLRGRLSTVDLLVQTVLISCFDIENIIYLSCKTSYLTEEINCTESLSLSVECSSVRSIGDVFTTGIPQLVD